MEKRSSFNSRKSYWKSSVIILFFFILNNIFSQQPVWYKSYEDYDLFNFTEIHFVNTDTGWIAGMIWDSTPPNAIKSLILKTIDGGDNWFKQVFDSLSNHGFWVRNIDFDQNGIGLISTSDNIYNTQDGGESWEQILSNSDTLNIIVTSCIINDSTFLVGGGLDSSIIITKDSPFGSKILKTNDFGNTWKTVFNDTLYPIMIIEKIDKNTYIANSGSKLILSLDKGNHWDIISEVPNSGFKSIQSVDKNLYALVDDYISENVYISHDLGKSWKPIYTFDQDEHIFCLHFADSLIGRAGGITHGDVIYKTINGGHSWSSENLPIDKSIWDIFTFKEIAFAGTGVGILLKYGIHTTIQTNPIKNLNPHFFTLNQNYPNPFNPVTTISFSINKASDVSIDLYDILGRYVLNIDSKNFGSGDHKVTFNAKNLSSGKYIYRLNVSGHYKYGIMTLLK